MSEDEQLTIEEKVEQWDVLQTKLKSLKALEMQVRKEICAHVFGDRTGKFSEKLVIGNYELKADSKTTKKIDEPGLNSIWDMLGPHERDCIKHKPSLVEAKYKKLSDDSILHDYVTESPSAPTLSITAKLDIEESPFK